MTHNVLIIHEYDTEEQANALFPQPSRIHAVFGTWEQLCDIKSTKLQRIAGIHPAYQAGAQS